jgi:hypothetical protein
VVDVEVMVRLGFVVKPKGTDLCYDQNQMSVPRSDREVKKLTGIFTAQIQALPKNDRVVRIEALEKLAGGVIARRPKSEGQQPTPAVPPKDRIRA